MSAQYNRPKNDWEVMRLFEPVAVANAVQAAHGNVQDFEDALQEGRLLAIQAWRSADPRKGDIYQYVCLRMTDARRDARNQAIEPVESETDLGWNRDDDESEPVVETFQTLEDPFDRPDWAQYGPLTNAAVLDDEMAELLAYFERSRIPVVADTDGSADEKSPTYVYPVPAPEPQPGSAFAIYGGEFQTLEDWRPERLTSMQDEHGRWPDSQTLTPDEIEVVDGGLTGEPIEDEPVVLEDGEPDPDAPYEPFIELPALEEVEAGLDAFFASLPKPAKYSRASREAFCRAMLHGAGMKAAQSAAWSVNRKTVVAVRSQGLVLGSGKVVTWDKVNAWTRQLDASLVHVCSQVASHLNTVPAAMHWVELGLGIEAR